MRFLFWGILTVCLSTGFFWVLPAQTLRDSLSHDSLGRAPAKEYNPSKAALYSTVLPGMGQAYNRKYWKIPIIYGLGATLGYFISWNNNRYLEFDDSVQAKLNEQPETDPRPFISLDAARRNRTFFRRNREFLVILTILLHGLNIVDATVDAHLRTFDIGDALSLQLSPQLESLGGQASAGLSLFLRWK